MKRIVSLLLALMMSVSLMTACVGTSQDEVTPAPQTEAPTGVITEAPTEAPTEVPTEEPTAEPTLDDYREDEIRSLIDFLEQEDENGVRNGEKLSENYNSNNPETWGDGFIWKSVYDEYDEDDKSTKFITYIDISGYDLVGTLDVSDCRHLTSLYCANNRLTKLLTNRCLNIIDVSNNELETLVLPSGMLYNVNFSGNESLHEVEVRMQNTSVEFTDEYYLKKFEIQITDGNIVFDERTLSGSDWGVMAAINLGSEGNGYVGVSSFDDQDYTVVNIVAISEEGAEFIGWYDLEGNFISDDQYYEINGEHGYCVGIFNYIAKFE